MTTLAPLPTQPEALPWPTHDWPAGALDPAAARVAAKVRETLLGEEAAGGFGDTLALLAIWRGRLVCEYYGDGVTSHDTQRSWSMAKSIVHALSGLLVGDGKLDTSALAPVSEWRGVGDPRATITLEHLLRMTDGLGFVEEYVPGQRSDVIEMLFASGKQDVAAYARQQPASHPPGLHWNYSSGTTNILSEILGAVVGGGERGMAKFMDERLFAPLGMSSAKPRFDAAGTFIGSSFVFATARDFARFGLLYLRDGVWEDERLLPAGWVDHARSQTPSSQGEYGAHWWLGRGGPHTFCAVGYEGQYLILDPTRDLIVLRLGRSTPEQRERVEEELHRLVASVPPLDSRDRESHNE